jgi:hypothetical protein
MADAFKQVDVFNTGARPVFAQAGFDGQPSPLRGTASAGSPSRNAGLPAVAAQRRRLVEPRGVEPLTS